MKDVPGTDYIPFIKTTGNYQVSKKSKPMIPETVPDYLNHEKSLEERLEFIDLLIDETKERLKAYPECAYPKEHFIYKMRLHSYELVKGHLRDALFEEITKR